MKCVRDEVIALIMKSFDSNDLEMENMCTEWIEPDNITNICNRQVINNKTQIHFYVNTSPWI